MGKKHSFISFPFLKLGPFSDTIIRKVHDKIPLLTPKKRSSRVKKKEERRKKKEELSVTKIIRKVQDMPDDSASWRVIANKQKYDNVRKKEKVPMERQIGYGRGGFLVCNAKILAYRDKNATHQRLQKQNHLDTISRQMRA